MKTTSQVSKFLVMKDAFWQIAGRMISALSGFVIVLIMSPLLGPLRYGDYTTILSYFALRSALSDLGLYVIGLKEIGKLKAKFNINTPEDLDHITLEQREQFSFEISQFVWARIGQIILVYSIAILVAYFIPAYSGNMYLARGLPLGMLFSAGFMLAGIIQLPLQLFRKMEQVSIALVLARVAQLGMLGIIVRGGRRGSFDYNTVPLALFLLMVGSVALSSIVQTLYTLRKSNKYVKLRFVPFWKPMLRHIRDNGKYGLAFFLSSFHMLLISIMISIVYPTVDGFVFAGIRGLGLQLIQVLLIIPTSIANSLIHKISALSKDMQRISFGHLMTILIFFGWMVVANFFLFATPIIRFVSGEKYLLPGVGFSYNGLQHIAQQGLRQNIGSDIVIAGLGIVLAFSFIKTIYNYVFVAANHQNTLLPINLFGLGVGGIFAIILVRNYKIIGGIIGQLAMEILFVAGSIYYAHKYAIAPVLAHKKHRILHIFFSSIIGVIRYSSIIDGFGRREFLIAIIAFNLVVLGIWMKSLLKEFQELTLSLESEKIENQVIEHYIEKNHTSETSFH